MAKCAIPECDRRSKGYFMGWENVGEKKKWGYVCGTHDKFLGRSNLKKYADMELEEAIKFERKEGKDEI